jgi:hypothetical protein
LDSANWNILFLTHTILSKSTFSNTDISQQPVEAVGNENYFVRCVKQKFIYDIICCAAWIAQCLVLYFIRFEWHFYSPITENTICPYFIWPFVTSFELKLKYYAPTQGTLSMYFYSSLLCISCQSFGVQLPTVLH